MTTKRSDDELYQRLTSPASRSAADRLFMATAEELNKAYYPGKTETNTSNSKSVQDMIDHLRQIPSARAAYDRQVEIIKAGKQIRDWRETAGLTQRELAVHLHVDETVIAQMESGENDVLPTTAEMRKIAKICGMS